jgi:hypothetical protein
MCKVNKTNRVYHPFVCLAVLLLNLLMVRCLRRIDSTPLVMAVSSLDLTGAVCRTEEGNTHATSTRSSVFLLFHTPHPPSALRCISTQQGNFSPSHPISVVSFLSTLRAALRERVNISPEELT